MIKFTNLERCYDELKDQLLSAYDEIQKSGCGIDGKYCNCLLYTSPSPRDRG